MAEKSEIPGAGGEVFDDTLLVVESTVLRAADLSAPIAQIIPSDDQFASQWHLHNPGNERTDLNIIEVWDEYRGAGILVGGLDDGFDYLHPDIAPNYRTDLDFDAVDNDFDAAPGTSGDNHGTTTSGMIIAALDGSGVVGIAPEAGFVGYRIGFGPGGTMAQIVTQLENMVNVDVANNSWGFTNLFSDDFQSSSFAGVAAAIDDVATNGRGGLGTNIVFSAGNSRASGENVNYHNLINSPDTIAVAATDINGNIAWFSTPGAAILVAAPGVDIVTTDRVGADGYSITDFATVNGTSFSAPAVTGVIALMLDANEDLGYRDVQEILAYSAHNPTDSNAGWFTNGAGNWNGGGLVVSDDYGFGLADAHAAVRLAEVWEAQSTKANLATLSATSAPGIAIVDLATISDQISLSSNLTIDQIQVAIDISHTWIGDLTVTLTSPDGTVSTLVNRPGKDPDSSGFGSSANDIQFTLSSVQFWGESGDGTWTLSVSDAFNADTGTLNSWTLTLLGDTASADDTYIYTDEWARHGGEAGRGTIIDSNGGIDTLNFAAVTADIDLSLAAGGGTTLYGHAITIGAGTAIENAIGGDGDDTLRGTDAANTLKGMRGNDRLEGGRGDDLLEGGAGDDTYVYNSGDGNDRFYDTGGDDLIEYHGAGTVTAISRDGDDMLVDLSDLTVLRIVDHFAGAQIERLSGDSFGVINLGGSLIGGDGQDVLFGSDVSDIMSGGAGDDTLFAALGNDRLIGGLGNDTLYGGGGNDTYVFERGDGDDLIYDDYWETQEVITTVVVYSTVTTTVWVGDSKFGSWQTVTRIVATTEEQSTFEEVHVDAGLDTLEFGAGIAIGDILAQQSGQDLLVSVSDPGGGAAETIVIQDWFNPINQIETFRFADGTEIDVSQVGLVRGILDVDPANQGPVAADDTATVTEDTAQTLLASTLVANDLDMDGDALSITGVSSAVNGTVSLDGNGDVVFTPTADFAGAASFQYTVSDPSGATDVGQVSLTVTAVADAPRGISLDNASVDENAAGAVIGNLAVSDPDAGDSHTFTVSDARFEVVGGQLKLKAGQSLDYEAATTVNVGVTATDAAGLTFTQGFVVTVIDDPNDPSEGDDVLVGTAGVDQIDALGGNDRISGLAGADTLHGGLGDDTYVFGRGDGDDLIYDDYRSMQEVTTTVSVDSTVTTRVWVGDSKTGRWVTTTRIVTTTEEQTSIEMVQSDAGLDTLEFGAGIALGDILALQSGQDLLVSVSDPGGGATETITIQDWFNPLNQIETFRFADGTAIDVSQATLRDGVLDIDTANQAPVATDDTATTNQDTALTLLANDLLANDIDSDGDPLTLTGVSGAVNGTVSLNASGDVLFTPAAGYVGAASFQYTVSDPLGESDVGQVSLTVTAVNHAPTAISLDGAPVDENAAGAVIGNLAVTDPDAGDSHTFTVSDARFEVVGGQLKLKAGQSLDYEAGATVNVGVTATDTGGLAFTQAFVITVIDDPTDPAGSGGAPGDDVVLGTAGDDRLVGGRGNDTLYGLDGNDTYVFWRGDGDDLIYDDARSMQEVTSTVTVYSTVTTTVWVGDSKFGSWQTVTQVVATTEEQTSIQEVQTDAGSDTLEFGPGIGVGDILARQSGQDLLVSVSDPGGGAAETIVIQDWFNPMNQIETFRFADGTALDVSQATLRNGVLDIDPSNQAPVAADDTATATEDTALTLLANDLLADDFDPDGDVLSLTGVGGAVNGTVSLDGNGDVVFTPTADFAGAASFQYTVSDPSGATDVAQVSLTVTAVADAPRAISLDNASVDENAAGAVIGNLAVSDPDAGDSHTFTVSDARFEVVGGQLKLKAGQSLDYETATSVNVGVTATDAAGLAFTQGFVVTVINDPSDPSEGDDVLVGTAGVDRIDALGGNDRISGLAGSDTLHGGAGNDTYVFGRGDGDDLIYDDYRPLEEVTTTVVVYSTVTTRVWVGDSKFGHWETTTRTVATTQEQTTIEEVQSDAGSDTLEFGTGIALGDILAQQSGQDLLVSVSDPGGGATETITIQDWFNPMNQIETFRFADGTAIDVSQATLVDGVLDLATAGPAVSGGEIVADAADDLFAFDKVESAPDTGADGPLDPMDFAIVNNGDIPLVSDQDTVGVSGDPLDSGQAETIGVGVPTANPDDFLA